MIKIRFTYRNAYACTILVFAGMFCTLLLKSCDDDSPQPASINLSGVVSNRPHNGFPKSTLYVEIDGLRVDSSKTASSGRFNFDVERDSPPVSFKLVVDSDGHDYKDSLLLWRNHDLNLKIDVTSEDLVSNYDLSVVDDFNSIVVGADVFVYKDLSVEPSLKQQIINNKITDNVDKLSSRRVNHINDVKRNVELANPKSASFNPNAYELLFSGETNAEGKLQQGFNNKAYIWQGDTILEFYGIKTDINSINHQNEEIFSSYSKNIELEAVLTRLENEESANINIMLKNDVMDLHVAGATYKILNEYGDILQSSEETNYEGRIQGNIMRGFTVNNNDTVYDFNKIIIPISAQYHELDTLNFDFENINAEHILKQIQYFDEAILNAEIKGQPLDILASNIELQAKYNDFEIGNATTNNEGVASMMIPYSFYQYQSQKLKFLNGEEITGPISIFATNPAYEAAEFQKEFSNIMNLIKNMQITPTNKTANIYGIVTEMGTSNPINNVSVDLSESYNGDDFENADETQSNPDGAYSFELDFIEYTNPNNASHFLRQPSLIQLGFSINTHQDETTSAIPISENVEHNQELESLLEEYDITITPYTFDNEHASNVVNGQYTLHIKNKTLGVTQSITQSGTSPMNITIIGMPDDEIQLWHNHEELADLLIIQHQNQAWSEYNIAQNRPQIFWSHDQPIADTTQTTLANLANPAWNHSLELYTPRYHLYTSNNELRTYNGEVLNMIVGRAPGGGLIKKRTQEHATNPDLPALEVFIWAYHMTTNEPIPENRLDEMITVNDNIMQYTTTPTGRELLPINTYIVYDMSQPEVIAAQEREWTYTTATWRESGPPGNSFVLDPETLTINSSSSVYDLVTTTGVIQEEQFQALLGSADPSDGGTASYITAYDNNGIATPNLLGQTMIKTTLLVDPVTWTIPSGKTAEQGE